MTRLRRELCDGQMQYMRGCEAQDGKRREDCCGRMGLHDHFVLRSKVPLREKDVRRLAMAAGFGHSVKVVPVQPGSKREAYYVSKYVVKTADSRADVPWTVDVVDVATGEVVGMPALDVRGNRRARYRTWSCSREWGVTMAQVRAEGKAWHEAQAHEADDVAMEAALALLAAQLALIPSVAALPDG